MLTPRTPRLVKHKSRYSLVFYDPRTQRRKWIALGTESKTTAERRARPMILAYERGEWHPWRDVWSDAKALGTVLEAWTDAKRSEGMRPRSIGNTRYLVEELVKRLPSGCTADAVTEADVRQLVMRPRSAAGRVSYRRVLHAFFAWAVRHGHAAYNPTENIRLARPERRAPVYLSPTEVRDVIAAAHTPEVADLIQFAVATGLRRGEILALSAKDVDLERGVVRVSGLTAKGRADRLVPLSAMSREAFLRQRHRRPTGRLWDYHPDRLSTDVKAACARAGVGHAHLHTMRHTFASWLRIRGVGLDRIQYWLGHTSIAMTMVYAHIEPDAIKAELAAVFDPFCDPVVGLSGGDFPLLHAAQ